MPKVKTPKDRRKRGGAPGQARPKYDLDELLAGITPENLNIDREWLDAPAVGREFPNQE